MYLQGLVWLTRKGDERWVKKIADSARLFPAVRFRAGFQELRDISQMKFNRSKCKVMHVGGRYCVASIVK